MQSDPLSEFEDMSRLLPIGITAYIIASLAIFLFGDSGLTAFRSMSQYERNLSGNVEDLEQRNAELQARFARLEGMLAEGTLKAVVGAVLPFEELPKAHALLQSRGSTGKVVVTL